MNIEELLSYPLDADLILRKKNRIHKRLIDNEELKPLKIAVLGGSTTSELINILEVFLLKNGFKGEFYESEYNKYFEDALFNIDTLKAFKPDLVVVHTSFKNVVEWPQMNATEEIVQEMVEAEIGRYRSIWDSLAQLECAVIQNNFDMLPERVLGNMDGYALPGASYFVSLLNLEMAKEARSRPTLYLNDIHYLCAQVGLEHWHDPQLWCVAKYAMSMEAVVEVAFSLNKIIVSLKGGSKKCLVLDLDNTCWGGVIGDDGLDGIAIGTETAYAEAFTNFQNYVKKLHSRGITLAVCSKNDFENAKEGFSHPDSILKFDNFTSFQANWEPKSLNIENIAKDINIGLDSLVFVDDNPAEREIVRSQLGHVSVPEVGNDAANYIRYVDRNGYFEPVAISADDLKRNKQYEQNKQRKAASATFANYDEFLASLEMTAEIDGFKDVYLERITQLTNKTNQFNLTTKRYTSAEIEAIASSENHVCIYGRLIDKFGDNGLIALSAAEVKGNEAHLDLWLMSCRVLKRGMEQAMLDEMVSRCLEKGVTKIIGYYYKTAKNSMVESLYETFGFSLASKDGDNTVWELSIDNTYQPQNKFIGVTHG